MNKVSIITLGCKQNKYESDCMANILTQAGYVVTQELEFADIYIINTCAVTGEAEKKSRQYIAKINKLNDNARIIICGCASENNIEQFKSKRNVYSIIGTQGKENILTYIENAISEVETLSSVYISPSNPHKTTTREYLKIQDGCDNFCSYCIIPYLRGRSRSRNLNDIIAEAKLISKRSKEIVLTGIDISSFRVDKKPGLPILLESLKDIPAIIRLGSLEVNVINEEFLNVLSQMKNFAPHFHLSLQSGDNVVLKDMNRHYTREEFIAKTELIKKYFPSVNLTTDVIVGFGRETSEQFENTKQLIEQVGFSFVHVFPYSKRLGTSAYGKFPDLPNSIKKERVGILEEVNGRLKQNFLSNFIGKTSTFIAEEKKTMWEGFSPEYIRCYVDTELENGKQYDIIFDSMYQDGVLCKVLNNT